MLVDRLIGSSGRINTEQCKKLTSHHLEQISSAVPFCTGTLSEKIYLIHYGYTQMPVCICGASLPFKNFVQGFQHHCSSKCAKNDPSVIAKYETTNREKYGVGNPLANPLVQAKVKTTLISKYGVDNVQKIKGIRQKTVATNVQRYGTTNPMQNRTVQETLRQTLQEKYGVDNIMHSSVGVAAVRKAFVEKYGAHPSSTPEGKLKIQKTHNKKYATSETYGQRLYRLQNYHDLILTSEKKENCSTELLWQHKKCGTEFSSNLENGRIPLCPVCSESHSRLEFELVEYAESLNVQCLVNDRNLIAPQEVDIWIPAHRCAIEMNGFYWHTDEFKSPTYHLNKTIECEAKEVQLIHIFQDEWDQKREIVHSRIQNSLGQTGNRIFARQCKIRKIDLTEASEFFENTHIQGSSLAANENYGLFHEGQLVSAMAFGKSRFRTDIEWEMLRFSSQLNSVVIGGAERLFKSFVNGPSLPVSVVTYADRRWSQGRVYTKLGFAFEKNTRPNHWYVKGSKRYNRLQFQKHKLAEILPNFDAALTEKENMRRSNYQIIYDCGNKVFLWKK